MVRVFIVKCVFLLSILEIEDSLHHLYDSYKNRYQYVFGAYLTAVTHARAASVQG
jgi:hypothetical protein